MDVVTGAPVPPGPVIEYVADGQIKNWDVYGPGRPSTGRRIYAYADGKNVGNLILSPDGIHILLWVHPEFRRQGIATAMFTKAKDEGWKPRRGAKDVSADAKAWADVMDWSS